MDFHFKEHLIEHQCLCCICKWIWVWLVLRLVHQSTQDHSALGTCTSYVCSNRISVLARSGASGLVCVTPLWRWNCFINVSKQLSLVESICRGREAKSTSQNKGSSYIISPRTLHDFISLEHILAAFLFFCAKPWKLPGDVFKENSVFEHRGIKKCITCKLGI